MEKKIHVPSFLIAVGLFCALLFFPVVDEPQAQKALALLVMVAVLWVTEAIPLPLTGLMIPVLAIYLQLTSPKDAFREFANPVIFLFMGGFVLAGALSKHSLDKLLAQKLIKLSKGNFYWSSVLLMLATGLVSWWVSNTSSAAMMIPLGLGMLVLVDKQKSSPESKFLLLGIAYSANIGGITTLIGSPPNAIGGAIMGISFSEWLLYGIPIFLLTFPVTVLVLTLYFKPDRKLRLGEMELKPILGAPLKTLGILFFIIVALWMLEGVLAPLFSITDSFSSLVAVIAIFLVFITGSLQWEEIIKSIQWEVLLLFGGGLTLGMIIDKSGLGSIMVGQVAGLLTVVPLLVFLWIIVLFSILLTEFMSNTASAALILPILYTMANQMQINPMLLVFPATIAATYGFMMPVGTPPNAMVYSSGFVPQKDMMRAGLVLNILFSIVLTVMFYIVFR
ncbi:DASS family sodium-coupled anion symporter [Nibribacter ruber]|uniref:DASS family sodium-coupled anion symporter n=1 Tax=Nibribacter ruber TaxID=2698458 RepID=A0A6P1NSF1_9BACT|nr:DASS family sodium-coupled anion symporter [Nibribacter ruber]QHL86766.1 DASS family sodium-coupled anion symporter [Nibribacter ruber]